MKTWQTLSIVVAFCALVAGLQIHTLNLIDAKPEENVQAYADPAVFHKADGTFSIYGACKDTNGKPLSTSTANLTVYNETGNAIINNIGMTQITTGRFYYKTTGPQPNGNYFVEINCTSPAGWAIGHSNFQVAGWMDNKIPQSWGLHPFAGDCSSGDGPTGSTSLANGIYQYKNWNVTGAITCSAASDCYLIIGVCGTLTINTGASINVSGKGRVTSNCIGGSGQAAYNPGASTYGIFYYTCLTGSGGGGGISYSGGNAGDLNNCDDGFGVCNADCCAGWRIPAGSGNGGSVGYGAYGTGGNANGGNAAAGPSAALIQYVTTFHRELILPWNVSWSGASYLPMGASGGYGGSGVAGGNGGSNGGGSYGGGCNFPTCQGNGGAGGAYGAPGQGGGVLYIEAQNIVNLRTGNVFSADGAVGGAGGAGASATGCTGTQGGAGGGAGGGGGGGGGGGIAWVRAHSSTGLTTASVSAVGGSGGAAGGVGAGCGTGSAGNSGAGSAGGAGSNGLSILDKGE